MVEMQLRPQTHSIHSDHRKMDLVMPKLEDELLEVEDCYNQYYSTEYIRNADLDEVVYCAKRKKSLLILTTKVNNK